MLTFLSFDELAMKTARHKKKYLQKRVRILYLLLNFLVAIFLVSNATAFGYKFFITLLVIIGFLTASVSLLFKKKAYRVRAVPVIFFSLACFLDLLFIVESIDNYGSHASPEIDSIPFMSLILLLILNLFLYGINISLNFIKNRKQDKYIQVYILYLLALLVAESANMYKLMSIPDVVLSIFLFPLIGEFLVIGFKTYKKAKKKFKKVNKPMQKAS